MLKSLLKKQPVEYRLPMTRGYVRHWGVKEAARELLQNAIDFAGGQLQVELGGGQLRITSPGATLPARTLLLGSSTKADDARTIGSFGEGYKLALLVLTRQGYPTVVVNDDKIWTPSFKEDSQFGEDVLCITEEACEPTAGVEFLVTNLSPEDEADIRACCLHLQSEEEIGRLYRTHMGNILLDRPGQLFVGGLFVCETEMKFSYDFAPQFLRLERDRQTVSSFDLAWAAKDMWFHSGQFDEVAALVEQDVPDLKYANYGTPELVKEACYRVFQQRHPGAIAAKSQAELENLVAQGFTKVVVVSETFRDIVMTSSSMIAQGIVRPLAPKELLQQFFADNRKHMRRHAIVDFKRLLEQSSGWRLS